MVKQNLLVCLRQEGLNQALLEKAGPLGFKVQGLSQIPTIEQMGSLLPDLFLVDMEWISEAGLSYLEEIYESFPSIWTVVLSDLKYAEEDLALTLRSGARGWTFKQEPEKILAELKSLLEKGCFLKPFVSQFILEEFRNFSSGEPLLPVEEEILRGSASGLSLSQIQKNLNLSKKNFRSHWENIWQKLNINARAKAEVESQPAAMVPEPPTVDVPSGDLPPSVDVPSRDLSPTGTPTGLPADLPSRVEPGSGRQERRDAKHVETAAPAEPLWHDQIRKKEEKSEVSQLVQSLQLVTFRLGKEEFALNITQLQEIQRMLPVTPIPKVPFFVEGIVNLRGRIVPIIDLRKRFGLEPSPATKDTRIIVVHVEEKIIGMIVDSVQEVLRTHPDTIEPPPSLVLRMESDYIQGVINLDERLILLLDAGQIIRYDEKERSVQVAGG